MKVSSADALSFFGKHRGSFEYRPGQHEVLPANPFHPHVKAHSTCMCPGFNKRWHMFDTRAPEKAGLATQKLQRFAAIEHAYGF